MTCFSYFCYLDGSLCTHVKTPMLIIEKVYHGFSYYYYFIHKYLYMLIILLLHFVKMFYKRMSTSGVFPGFRLADDPAFAKNIGGVLVESVSATQNKLKGGYSYLFTFLFLVQREVWCRIFLLNLLMEIVSLL